MQENEDKKIMDRVKQQSFLGCAKALGQALCQNPTYTILPDDMRLSILINCCKVYLKELKTAKDNAEKYRTKVNHAVIAENFIDYLLHTDWVEMVAKNEKVLI